MKNCIAVLMFIGCSAVAIAQDSTSRFSVGLIAGNYFNTGITDNFYPIPLYNTWEIKTRSLAYGIELTKYFAKQDNSSTRHGISGRFLYSLNKTTGGYTGPATSNHLVDSSIHTVASYIAMERNYLGSIGYRLLHELTNRVNLIIGSDIQYIFYEKKSTQSEQTETANTGEFIYYRGNKRYSPGGYSVGIGVSTGLEYAVSKKFSVGCQITQSIFYTHFFGKGESKSVDRTSSHESTTVYETQYNTYSYHIGSLNYNFTTRYYF